MIVFFTANSALSTLPYSQPSFSNLHTIHLSMLSIIWYLLLPRTYFPFIIPSRASYSKRSFLASDPVNFSPYSLSVPALFFLLPLFLAQLHFLFWLSILHAPSISNASNRFCSFRRNVQVSAPLNAILYTKHFTSVFLFSFSKGPQKMLLFLFKVSSSALLLDSSSCCSWYYTPSIWSCPFVQWIHL